jgi:hypothetical protein
MKTIATAILCLSILSFLVMPGASAVRAGERDFVARVSRMEGKAASAREKRSLALFDGICENDEISVSPGSSMGLIFYSDYHEEMLKGPCTIQVGRNASIPRGAPAHAVTITRVTPTCAVCPNPSRRGREVTAGIGGKIIPGLKKTYQVKVSASLMECETRPLFSWPPPDPCRDPHYRFLLKRCTRSGPVLLLDRQLEAPSFALPEAMPPLAAGEKYQCVLYVYDHNPGDTPAGKAKDGCMAHNEDSPFEFVVPSKEAMEFLRREEETHGKVKNWSPGRVSSAVNMIMLYLDYGMVERAEKRALELDLYLQSPRP